MVYNLWMWNANTWIDFHLKVEIVFCVVICVGGFVNYIILGESYNVVDAVTTVITLHFV